MLQSPKLLLGILIVVSDGDHALLLQFGRNLEIKLLVLRVTWGEAFVRGLHLLITHSANIADHCLTVLWKESRVYGLDYHQLYSKLFLEAHVEVNIHECALLLLHHLAIINIEVHPDN